MRQIAWFSFGNSCKNTSYIESKYAQNISYNCRALYNNMELCPKSLDVKLKKNIKNLPKLFKNGTLQLSELFQHFIKAVGHAVSELKSKQSPFRAENGVIIDMDSDVCNLPQCMEDDGIKKVYRFKMKLNNKMMQFLTCLLTFHSSQCKHTIPAVCMTRVGVGLNLLILTNGQKKLFTVDLVPAIQVKVPKDFDGLKLRQVPTVVK